MTLPVTGWSEDQFEQLHPDLGAALIPALLDAERELLRVRFRSGYRSAAEQKELHDTYGQRLELWKAGKLKNKPLPAAPPHASAHNYCQADGRPASLASDVQILGPTGQPIPSGGSIPLEQRPLEWQRWAAIVARHPLLRDGGTFSKPDTVHVELARWDYKARNLKHAPTLLGLPIVESATLPPIEGVTVGALNVKLDEDTHRAGPAPADATAVARPRRRPPPKAEP